MKVPYFIYTNKNQKMIVLSMDDQIPLEDKEFQDTEEKHLEQSSEMDTQNKEEHMVENENSDDEK